MKKNETSNRIGNMFVDVGYNTAIHAHIIYDTENKVMYAVLNSERMIVLVDENGKPKLWNE